MVTFHLDRSRLDQLIEHYETIRGRGGMGSMLLRVTPGQRIDALHICIAAYASGRVPAGDQRAFWLATLRPVLAETRESAAALGEAFDRLTPKPISTGTRYRARLNAWKRATVQFARRRRALLSWRNAAFVGAVLLAATGIYLAMTWSSRDAPPTPPPATPADNAQTTPPPPTPPGPDANEAAYRGVLDVTMRAVDQYGGSLTPHALAAVLAAKYPVLGTPSAVLAGMLRKFPMPPLKPLPHSPLGALALRQYTGYATAGISGLSTATFTQPLNDVAPTGPTAAFYATSAEGRLAAFSVRTTVDAGTPDTPATSPPSLDAWPWWFVALPFLILLPGSVWAFWGLGQLRREVQSARLRESFMERMRLRRANAGEWGKGSIYQTSGLLLPPLPPGARAARRLIRLRETRPGFRLDAARSLRATLAAGGDLVTVMRPASRATDFVFLVRRRHRHDHERARVLRLLDVLSSAGVSLTAYDYAPDPRLLTATSRANEQRGRGPQRTLDLRGLRELHADAMLVLVTDGEELIEPYSQTSYKFVTEELRRWPRRMLLTPVPVAEWGEREMLVAAALDAPVGRASLDGMGDLALGLAPDAPEAMPRRLMVLATSESRYLQRVARWVAGTGQMIAADPMPARPEALRDDNALTGETLPAGVTEQDVIIALKRWLGTGFLWLATCGVYPQLRFDLTLWLGKRLRRFGHPDNAELFSEPLFDRLCALPWFRYGHMPEWLRLSAFAALTAREQQMARAAVSDLLRGRNRVAGGVSLNLPVWQADWHGQPLTPDDVMLEIGDGPASIAAAADLEVIKAQARQEAMRLWLRRAALRIGALLGWAVIAAWLWPSPGAAPHPAGAWWPLLAFAGTSVVFMATALLVWRLRRGLMPAATAPIDPPVAEAA